MNKFGKFWSINTLISLLIASPLSAEGVIRTRQSFGEISNISLSTSATDRVSNIYGTTFFVKWDNLNQVERNDLASDVIGWVDLRFRNSHNFKNGTINAEVVQTLVYNDLVPLSGRCNIQLGSEIRLTMIITCNLKSPKGQIVLRGKVD
jgi:hypothetical protein